MATEYTKGSSTIKVTGSNISRARVPLFRQMAPKSLPTSTISAEENSRRRSNFFSDSLLWGSSVQGLALGAPLRGAPRGSSSPGCQKLPSVGVSSAVPWDSFTFLLPPSSQAA